MRRVKISNNMFIPIIMMIVVYTNLNFPDTFLTPKLQRFSVTVRLYLAVV